MPELNNCNNSSSTVKPRLNQGRSNNELRSIMFIAPAFFFIVGILLCAYLLSVAFIPDAGKFCELLGTDCLSVIGSEYAKVFIFSSSSVGLAYFIFQLTILVGQRWIWPGKGNSPLPLFMISGGLALLASCYYLFLFLFMISDKCIACYGVHLINFLFFSLCLFWFRNKKLNPAKMLKAYTSGEWLAVCITCLFSIILLLCVNIVETRFQLGVEQQKGSMNLSFAHYRHSMATKHEFQINKEDTVYGNKAIAFHEIVLVYKDGCGQCLKAKEKLIPIAEENPDTIYLVLKKYSHFPAEVIEILNITHVPMVFVNGREAEGWDLPDFFADYIADRSPPSRNLPWKLRPCQAFFSS